MGIIDFLILPVYLSITYLVLYLYRSTLSNPYTKTFFIPAFTAKVIGFIAFACIYQFYYNGGDTYNYFASAKVITNVFSENPIRGIRLLFLESGDLSSDLYVDIKHLRFFYSREEWNIVKYSALAGILSFNSYLGVCLFFTSFCFAGMWYLYEFFVRCYPEIWKSLAIVVLFAPSTIFWGSALMKDTLALGATCFLVGGIMRFFIFKERSLSIFLIIAVGVYVLLATKLYILLCVLPAMGVWWFIRLKRQIQSLAVKLLVIPILLALLGGTVYLGVISVASQSSEFADLNTIGRKVQGYHVDHGERAGGSVYTLGEIDYTIGGFIAKIPISIRVALFQPFPWEVNSIVMLLSSVESSIYLFLTIFILLKRGFVRSVKLAFSHSEVAFCLIFTLILAYIVGFTSFNYGALVRFKIPFLPFFGIALILIYYLPKYEMLNHASKSANNDPEM